MVDSGSLYTVHEDDDSSLEELFEGSPEKANGGLILPTPLETPDENEPRSKVAVSQYTEETLVMARNLERLKWYRPKDWERVCLIMYVPEDESSSTVQEDEPNSTDSSSSSPSPSPPPPPPGDSFFRSKRRQISIDLPQSQPFKRKALSPLMPKRQPTWQWAPATPMVEQPKSTTDRILNQIKAQSAIDSGIHFATLGQARFSIWVNSSLVQNKAIVTDEVSANTTRFLCLDEDCQYICEVIFTDKIWKVCHFRGHSNNCLSSMNLTTVHKQRSHRCVRMTKHVVKQLFYFIPSDLGIDEKVEHARQIISFYTPRYQKKAVQTAYDEHCLNQLSQSKRLVCLAVAMDAIYDHAMIWVGPVHSSAR